MVKAEVAGGHKDKETDLKQYVPTLPITGHKERLNVNKMQHHFTYIHN